MKTTLVMTVLLLAASVQATTWHVAKDGSGDFTVIQDAVDAASDGDVIWIHAGRYDEISHDFPLAGEGNAFRADVHVGITKDNLTLLGYGPDVTIIGSEETPPPPPFDFFGIGVTHVYASRLTIENLRIEHVRTGVYAVNPEIVIEGCRFANIVEQGMLLNLQSEALVRDCEFSEIGENSVLTFDVASILVENCSFEESTTGVNYNGTANAVTDACTFIGGYAAIYYGQGSHGSVSNCVVSGSRFYGLVASTGLSVELADCEFSGGDCGIWVDSPNSSITGTRCLLSDHSYATILIDSGHVTLHDSDIFNGGGYSVLCRGGYWGPYHIDLTNNYWGTDSADQIAEWIWDAVDDPDLDCTVDYIPFQGPVAVQSQTWSEVKALFEDPEQ